MYNDKEKYYFCFRKYNEFEHFLMQKYIKIIVSVCMLLLVVSHGIIQFGMFEFFRADYRAEAAKLIGEGVLEKRQIVFCFNMKEYKNLDTKIEWKDDREFRFEEKLYDIIRTEIRGDSVYVYCFYDEDDTMLYSVLDNLIEKDNDEPEETNGYGSFLNLYYYCADFDNSLKSPGADDNIYISPAVHLLDGEYLQVTPPPRYKA